MAEPATTLADWRRAAAGRLAGDNATDNAEAEARWLAEHVLGLTTTQLILADPRTLAIVDHERLEAALARRLSGVPLAQIIGRADFGPLELRVTPDVLIPRADTEVLVETVLATFAAERDLHVIDLGTGSGAIALMLADARPGWHITATDRSPAALTVARDNAAALGLGRVVFIESDWFANLGHQRFDVVVANPPYIAPEDTHLAALTHEPRQALVAADHGLADLAVIATTAPQHLRPGGGLFVEHGYDQGQAVRALLLAAGFSDVLTRADHAGRDRVTGGLVNRGDE